MPVPPTLTHSTPGDGHPEVTLSGRATSTASNQQHRLIVQLRSVCTRRSDQASLSNTSVMPLVSREVPARISRMLRSVTQHLRIATAILYVALAGELAAMGLL